MQKRKRVDEVRYVVVKRSGDDTAQEVESVVATTTAIQTTATPSAFASLADQYAPPQPTGLQVRDDDSGSDSDDEDKKPKVVWNGRP